MPDINFKVIRFEEFCSEEQEIRIVLKHKKPLSLLPLGLNFEMPDIQEEFALSTVSIVSKSDRNIDVYVNDEEQASDLMAPFCFLDGVFQIGTGGEIFIESAQVLDNNEEEIPESLKISNKQQFFGAGQMLRIEPLNNHIVVRIQLEERAKSELSFELFEVGKEFQSASIMLQHNYDHEDKCYFNIWRDLFTSDGKYLEGLREKVGYHPYFEGEPYTVAMKFDIVDDPEKQSTVDCFFQIGESIMSKKNVPISLCTLSHVRVRESFSQEPGSYIIENVLKKEEPIEHSA